MVPRARSVILAALVVFAFSTPACGSGDAEESDVPRASTEELGPCDKQCSAGEAGIHFVNASGGVRAIYVDGARVCLLDPDATCNIAIAAGELTNIHVTAGDGAETCSDPHATLGECACLNLEILC